MYARLGKDIQRSLSTTEHGTAVEEEEEGKTEVDGEGERRTAWAKWRLTCIWPRSCPAIYYAPGRMGVACVLYIWWATLVRSSEMGKTTLIRRPLPNYTTTKRNNFEPDK